MDLEYLLLSIPQLTEVHIGATEVIYYIVNYFQALRREVSILNPY